MNVLHMKYALAVAKSGSINKAAEQLLMNQPNLSRAIRELEASVGTEIFSRSAKGMEVTPDGEKFLRYAENILKQIDELEDMFKNSASRGRFFMCGTVSGYVSEAFAKFSADAAVKGGGEMCFKQTDMQSVIRGVSDSDFGMGIVRYQESFDKYYKQLFDEKQLECELVAEFRYTVVTGKDGELAKKEKLTSDVLSEYTQVCCPDYCGTGADFSENGSSSHTENKSGVIFASNELARFEILEKNPNAYMWSEPVAKKTLSKFGLVQIKCSENGKIYKDMLLRKRDYRLSELDNAFISELCLAKRKCFSERN